MQQVASAAHFNALLCQSWLRTMNQVNAQIDKLAIPAMKAAIITSPSRTVAYAPAVLWPRMACRTSGICG